MQIGFIGFGKVSNAIYGLMKSSDIHLATSKEKRSSKTADLIEASGITTYPSFRELCTDSDIVISANSPSQSLKTVEEYGKYVDGIYLDLNNISPKTTMKIAGHVENFVDGAIIGKVDVERPVLYLSGENASQLSFLDDYLSVKIVSENIGDAAILKMLRSTYTKSLSCLLIESSQIAADCGLYDEFFNVLELTEGSGFTQKSQSRINNTLNSSVRKSEELEEIIGYFQSSDLEILRACLEKLKKY